MKTIFNSLLFFTMINTLVTGRVFPQQLLSTGIFTEITPSDPLFITPADEDFWVAASAPADYDNDGDLDIAVFGYYVYYNIGAEYKLILLRSEGPSGLTGWNFSYVEVPLGSLYSGNSDLAWGDADNDGDLDLALGTNGETVIYRNDTGTLQMTLTSLPGYWEENSQAEFDLRSMTWADTDNDGDQDLLIPSVYDLSTFSFRTALMRNDGPDGNGGFLFTELAGVFAPTQHAQSHWADCDGDQDLDLLLVNVSPIFEESFIRLYKNEGNNLFTPEDIIGAVSVEHGEAQWGDYDGDGDLDILLAGGVREQNGTYTSMALRIYRNDSESYFPIDVIENIPAEGWFDLTAATWADYDSDGDMDILLAGNYNSGVEIEGRARIYKNMNNSFLYDGDELPAPRATGDNGGAFSWLDIDGEGDLDYFIAGQYFVPGGNGLVESQLHLYRNDTPAQNTDPVAPSGLSAVQVSEGTTLLSWTPGSDDLTAAAALTYELLLYKDDVPVINPACIPQPGNVSNVNEWLLKGLEDGIYAWTVRTIDASYSGSEVATGQFIIGTVSVDELKEKYSLAQNQPNPASDHTRISFYLPVEGQVTMKLFNAAGKEVILLLDTRVQPGEHQVQINTENFAAGLYTYTMEVNDHASSRKLLIVK